jgi:hypothetical protein
MSALLLLVGFIAGVVATIFMTHRIDRDVPAEIKAEPEADPLDIEIDAIEQWNQALLSVPVVKRPMAFGERRH